MRAKLFGVSFILFFLSIATYSQDIDIHGKFDVDSIRLGDEAAYHLTVEYPPNMNIILPDSTYDYGEFELNHRKWFPTRVRNSMLFDSVIYYLTTFQLDTVLHFQLPVFVVQPSDCLTYYTAPDSLYLKQVVTQLPDTLKLKADTRLLKFHSLFNYPLWSLIGGIFILAAIGMIVFFGKRILKMYRLFMMKRKHKKFVQKFYLKLGKLRDSHSDGEPEHVLHDWKKYMESLEKAPYTKLTTRELVRLYNDTVLIDNLKAIDRFIYGNIKDKPMYEYFSKLLEYSVNRFKVRLKEMQSDD